MMYNEHNIGERIYLYASSFLVCLETEITEKLIEKVAGLDTLPIKFIKEVDDYEYYGNGNEPNSFL